MAGGPGWGARLRRGTGIDPKAGEICGEDRPPFEALGSAALIVLVQVGDENRRGGTEEAKGTQDMRPEPGLAPSFRDLLSLLSPSSSVLCGVAPGWSQ